MYQQSDPLHALLLVLGDEEKLSRQLRAAAESLGFVVSICNDHYAAQPTIALLDLELPDGKGNSFIPTLLEQHPSCLCIVVTIYADERHLMPSLRAGAKGYILKDQSRQRIAEMLQKAYAGELPLSPSVASMVLNHFSQTNLQIEESPLTKRESDVLSLVPNGLSTPDVADQLNISKYTAEDHLKQIYRKLDISSRAEAALAAKKYNLV
jgi:DNA-binding NarL/FixJ family response regulator